MVSHGPGSGVPAASSSSARRRARSVVGDNALDPQYLSLGTGLNTLVDNPFFGSIPVGTLSQQRRKRYSSFFIGNGKDRNIKSEGLVCKKLEVSAATAGRLLKSLVDRGILHEVTGYSRNRKFAYGEYLQLLNEE